MIQDLDQNKTRITLALADGNPLVLGALSEVFDRDPRFSLVMTSSSAEGFLGAVMRVPVSLGIIDWRIPNIGGRKLIEILRDQSEPPRIIVYGESDNSDLPKQAMMAGAAGFISRSAPVDKLVETCLSVASGQMVFPFLDMRELQADPMQQLTKREKTLLEALARGLTNRDMAKDFSISANTVKFHLSNLYDKLGVQSRTQAIAVFYGGQTAREGLR